MPIHAWTRVTAGTFHDFHNAWITELRNALNTGILPPGYYALGEQRSGDMSPDVLTRHADTPSGSQTALSEANDPGMIAVAEHPPQVRFTLEASTDAAFYMARRRTLVIYHATGDRIVALVEILSPANKHRQQTVNDFLDEVIAALRTGYHVLVLNLFPPGRYDPGGTHGLLWEYLTNQPWQAMADRPLTVASYCARVPITAYAEPLSVGNGSSSHSAS